MIAWALYTLVVSLLFGLAAAAAERALRMYDRPARGVWAGAMLASLGVPLAAWALGGTAGAVPALPAVGVGEAVVGAGERISGAAGGLSLPPLEAALPGLWAASSAAVLLWLGLSYVRLRRALEACPTRAVGEVRVHLTRDDGPACWSLPGGRAQVLVPSWLRRLPPDLRRLALAHEREHLRRGDSALFAAGCLLVAAAPWNLPLWWQLRRLRRSVELDCDTRVLGSGADPRVYGDLLLAVGSRGTGSPWTALPLSEHASRLQTRIRQMTPEPTKMRLLRASAFALIAVVAGALACETSPPDPGTEADAAAERAPTDPPSVTGESAVNPNYDVAPELQNPREVQERLQELYPDSLQQAGVGGTVVLWMYVDQDGRVRESRVKESDGPEAFEGPAREVVEAMEFDPALQGEEPTGVWVQQKVSFRVE